MFVLAYVFWFGVFGALVCFGGIVAREYFRVTPVKPLVCKKAENRQEDTKEYAVIPVSMLINRKKIEEGCKRTARELPRIPKPSTSLLEGISAEHPAVFPTTGGYSLDLVQRELKRGNQN